MGVRVNGNAPTGVLENGFQRATHRKPPRIPTRPQAYQQFIASLCPHPSPGKEEITARAAYRKRQPHNATFKLEQDCDKIFPHIRKMYDYFEELGVRNGSLIRPPQHAKDRELLTSKNWEFEMDLLSAHLNMPKLVSCGLYSQDKREAFLFSPQPKIAREPSPLVGNMDVYTTILTTDVLLF